MGISPVLNGVSEAGQPRETGGPLLVGGACFLGNGSVNRASPTSQLVNGRYSDLGLVGCGRGSS